MKPTANDVSINLRVGVPFFPLPYTIFVVLPFHCHQEMEVVVQCTWNYMGKTRPVLDCFLVRLVHRPHNHLLVVPLLCLKHCIPNSNYFVRKVGTEAEGRKLFKAVVHTNAYNV